MKEPLISVLVPIYNVEKYLRECLDSLKCQTFEDLEIICINDGSTDSSREIIEEYLRADPRFKVIDKPNSGYGASMNMGLDQCTGKYIGILESDDFMNADGFEKMYLAAEKHDAEVVKSDFYLYWSAPTPTNKRFYLVDECISGVVNPQIEREIFYRKPSIWSAIYRRSFLEENDIRFLETPGASFQDSSFNFKVWASCTRAVMLNEAFLHYRQDNETSSVNSPGKVFCVCDEYSEMHSYLDSHHADRKYLRSILARMRLDTYEWNYQRLSPELKELFYPKLREDFFADDQAGYTDERDFEASKLTSRKILLNKPELYPALHATEGCGGPLPRFKSALRNYGFAVALQILLLSLR